MLHFASIGTISSSIYSLSFIWSSSYFFLLSYAFALSASDYSNLYDSILSKLSVNDVLHQNSKMKVTTPVIIKETSWLDSWSSMMTMNAMHTIKYHMVALAIQMSNPRTIPALSSSVYYNLCLLKRYITYATINKPKNEIPKRIYPKLRASLSFSYNYYYFFNKFIAYSFNLFVISVPVSS